MHKLFSNTMIYALGDICPKLFAIIVFPVLTTHLEPDQYGIINYVNTIDTFLSVLNVLCLNTFFLVYYYKEKGIENKKKLYSNISYFILAFSIFFSGLLIWAGPYISNIWGSKVDFYPYVVLCIITNVFNVVTFLPSCLYRVQENPLPLTILNVFKSLVIMGGTVAVVVAINGMALEVLIVRLVVSFIFAFIFIYSTRSFFVFYINLGQIKEALKFALPLVPGALAYYLFSLFDRVLIDKYLTLTDLGIYTTAATLALLLNIVSNGAYKAFEPYFFEHFQEKDFAYKFKIVRDSLLYAVLVGAMLLSVFAKEFFEVFASSSYSGVYKYVPIISIGVIASSMSLMYGTIIIARGKTFMNTLITIIGCTISIVLNVLTLERYGIIAAAIVFSIAFIIVLFANIFVAKVKVGHFKALVASLTAIISSIALQYCVNFDFWTTIVVKSLIVGIIILLLSKIIGIDFIQFYKMITKKI